MVNTLPALVGCDQDLRLRTATRVQLHLKPPVKLRELNL